MTKRVARDHNPGRSGDRDDTSPTRALSTSGQMCGDLASSPMETIVRVPLKVSDAYALMSPSPSAPEASAWLCLLWRARLSLGPVLGVRSCRRLRDRRVHQAAYPTAGKSKSAE